MSQLLIDKLKYLQGYVRVRLSGYAPERFLNLCSNRNILIWNLEYQDEQYEFCISVRGMKQLKPILKKTRTKLVILERTGFPFFLRRYRKRKLFFAGIVLCSAKLEGTMLVIDIQENLATNQQAQEQQDADDGPSDLVADKEAEIYSILTRKGTPKVEKGIKVQPGDLLVEGKNPVTNDAGEIASYQYCVSDADIFGITQYAYEDSFSMQYQYKDFSGRERASYGIRLFQMQFRFPHILRKFQNYDTITDEYNLKLGETFYLPIQLIRETQREYQEAPKKYSKDEAMQLAKQKLEDFCKELTEKGVQIIENNVMIVTDEKNCTACGTLKVIEPIGVRRATSITDISQERQMEDESDGEND